MTIPLFLRIAGLALLTFVSGAVSRATEILNVTTALTLADPLQLGRLSRNGIPQDWTGTEPFPGIVNPTTGYHYRTFTVDPFTVSLGPFIQISLDDLGPAQGNLFAAAYFTSYVPNSVSTGALGFDTHWLGDAGSPGNLAGGVDPTFFQVIAPVGTSLVVVVSNTAAANGGLGEPFKLIVESFSDTNYSDARTGPFPTPDGGRAALMLGFGLAGSVLGQRILRKSSEHGT